MKQDDRDPALPQFLLEAEPELKATELELLPELVLPVAPDQSARARLLGAIEQAPLRYAPFFDRLQWLWGVGESQVIATLAQSADASAWKRTPLRGVRVIDVPIAEGRGHSAYLVRFAAGLDYPKHRHIGEERVLLLEGGYRDSSGRDYGPGDLHEMLDGSEHGLQIHAGAACICAAVEHGFEFTGPVLRLLQRLVGRGKQKR